MVRIVFNTLENDPDYKDCVSRVLDLVKVKRMIEGSEEKKKKTMSINLSSVPDMHERSFSDDWLPSWILLSSSLIVEYLSLIHISEPTRPY